MEPDVSTHEPEAVAAADADVPVEPEAETDVGAPEDRHAGGNGEQPGRSGKRGGGKKKSRTSKKRAARKNDEPSGASSEAAEPEIENESSTAQAGPDQAEASQAGEAEPESSEVGAGEDESSESAAATSESDAGTTESDTTSEHELTTEQVVEAILFASDSPLTPAKLVSILGVGTARDVRKHIDALNARYAEQHAAYRIENIAGGYQMLTLPAFNRWVRRLRQSRHDSRLSQAALETLAVVAYKQPVVRAEVEAIRGVAAGEMLNRLRELGLIKIVGRAEDVGRPMLYGTTKRFLDAFGLSSLDDLPQVEELQSGGAE